MSGKYGNMEHPDLQTFLDDPEETPGRPIALFQTLELHIKAGYMESCTLFSILGLVGHCPTIRKEAEEVFKIAQAMHHSCDQEATIAQLIPGFMERLGEKAEATFAASLGAKEEPSPGACG